MKRHVFIRAPSVACFCLLSAVVLLAGCSGGSGGDDYDGAAANQSSGTRLSQTYTLSDTTGARYLGGDATSNRYRIVYEPLIEETAQ